MNDEATAIHNETAQRFEVQVDGHVGYAHYTPRGDRVLEFDHTYVPAALRGRGLAGVVVAAGLDYARRQGLKIVPSCTYVSAFIRRHPGYADLLAGDADG